MTGGLGLRDGPELGHDGVTLGAGIGTLVGGVGLFLLGMSLMTDSLTALGGRALRGLLSRLSSRPWVALGTSALVTSILQSSSATTLITVGFVSAGLLSFADSLALIFGANLGTTSTAWIVSLVGLKVDVSLVALPLIGAGALLRLVGRRRRARVGLAIAGFGLVFFGIDVMQSAMTSIDFDLQRWSAATGVLGVLLLVGIGIVMTVVMQSSSAAIAMTLVALSAGNMSMTQAAALVVGQNVGTTFTAIIGAAGGGLAARRAAVGHAMFNVGTAIVALSILGPFIRVASALGDGSPEIAIAIFHSAFNAMGVALFFPLRRRFARVVERLTPASHEDAIELPSSAVRQVPALALEMARRAAIVLARKILGVAVASLDDAGREDPGPWPRARELMADPRAILTGEDEATRKALARLQAAKVGIEELADYVGRLRLEGDAAALREEQLSIAHAVDHLRRLLKSLDDEDAMQAVQDEPELRAMAIEVARALQPSADDVRFDPDALVLGAGSVLATHDAQTRRAEEYRQALLVDLAEGRKVASDVDTLLRGARWIGKLPRHGHRALLHLGWTAASSVEIED